MGKSKNPFYLKDPGDSEKIREKAEAFSAAYVGSNILQDDIFPVIENYARRKDATLELLRIPVRDPEFFSCSFVRKGRIFVIVNSAVPLGQQNYSAARELWHIRKYLDEEDGRFPENGSIYWRKDPGDVFVQGPGDNEAETFAAMLLVPVDKLDQQIRIYGLKARNITMDDVLTLMEIFAVPYDVMVRRLFDECIVTEGERQRLLSVDREELKERIAFTGKAQRWSLSPPGSVKYGSMLENFHAARSRGNVTQERADRDRDKFERILKKLADPVA